ncbi:helix-turn-helix transcriptional regulator [Lysobacter sp. BMK333-48F3]|uniref:AraC family transcriptional regulator n=1 Tax=Lysobacter sp. BMK333-48F3 TaxID=2867962 RepID=UPI001C8B3C5F|nr:helix-turn-helix transcriptional regulator [Lysobacter sp. BMK333-48F3]MBX9401721.1 helix-turn-helix transcriptional regulator [Lysobacter sp. BMK333-48F3]
MPDPHSRDLARRDASASAQAWLSAAQADAGDGPAVIAVVGDASGPRATAPHRHARGQLLGARRGLLTVGSERGRWLVPPSDAVWMPPQAEHCLRSHGPGFAGWSLYVAADACAGLPAQPCALRVSGLLREVVARLGDGAEATPARARLGAVALDEIAAAGGRDGRLGLPMPDDPRLLRLAQALVEHPGDPRSAAEWAAWAHLSERSLRRRFAAETGYSLLQWRQRAGLMAALERLAAGVAVTTVAFDLGYASASAFGAMFRRHLGASPGAYLGAAGLGPAGTGAEPGAP